MSISKFAENINLPICNYLDHFATIKTDSTKDKISFLSGDPTIYGQFNFRMPQQGYEILKKHIRVQENHGYTASNGITSFRRAVTKLYKSKFQVNENSVFINHGVNMGLLTVLLAFVNPDDQILVPQIGYPFFTDVCPALSVKAIPYKLIKQKNFQIDLDNVQSLITEKTKFIFVINPSNPMGSIFSQNHMCQILKLCDKNQLPLVADEVYLRQSFSTVQHKSFGEVTSDVPVICLCGVQKIFSVPGWCNSWIIFFDKHNYLEQILKNISVLCTIFLHTNRFTQEALTQIIEKIGIFTHQKMPLIEKKHDLIIDLCKEIKCLRPIKAQGTIYISLELDFTNLQFSNDKQFCWKLYIQQNVSVLPLSVFSSSGANFQGLRVLTCAQQGYYRQFFRRLGEFAQRHKKI